MDEPIIFLTGNQNKLHEAQQIIPHIVGKDMDLPEIQELDPKKIIEAKLREACTVDNGAYIVEDTSLFIPAMGGLPGPLIKWFLKTVGDDGLARLALGGSDGVDAQAVTYIGYMDASRTPYFCSGVLGGTIVNPRGATGFGWDTIFIPKGHTRTFAEMTKAEKNAISMRKIAFAKLAKHIDAEALRV